MTTVILTRPVPALATAEETYAKAGLKVFRAPVFDIQTNTSVDPDWLRQPADMWVVLSVNALNHALKIDADLRPAVDTRVIAVGPAVAKAWKSHFGQVIEHHPLMNSEGVVELLQAYQPQNIQILTTGGGRELIRSHCMSRSISFRQINTYVRVPLQLDLEAIGQLYQQPGMVTLTATSSDILTAFVKQIPSELLTQVLSSPVVVGAERIAGLAKELGFAEVILASSPSDQAMAAAVVSHCNTA